MDDSLPQERPQPLAWVGKSSELRDHVERIAEAQVLWAAAQTRPLDEREARALAETLRALEIAGRIYRADHGIP